jgi:hypothetical protein
LAPFDCSNSGTISLKNVRMALPLRILMMVGMIQI